MYFALAFLSGRNSRLSNCSSPSIIELEKNCKLQYTWQGIIISYELGWEGEISYFWQNSLLSHFLLVYLG